MQFVLKTECFAGVGCGNPFRLASVGYGKVAFPRGKPVFAQAWGTGSLLPVCRNPFPLASVGYGEVFPAWEACFCTGVGGSMLPVREPILVGKRGLREGSLPVYRSPVSAQAWGTGSMLPVRDPIPVGKRGLREGCLPVREPCFCTGVVFGKVTPFGVLKL